MNLLYLLYTGFHAAVTILGFAPDTYPPRAVEWGMCVAGSAKANSIPASLLVAVVQHESQWNPDARSHTNDWGFGQLHCPSQHCGRSPTQAEQAALLDPCTNLEWTAQFLKQRGLRAYNPGSPSHERSVRAIASKLRRLDPQI